MNPSTSGFMPPSLVNAIKGELFSVHREGSSRTIMVEYWVRQGTPIEARVRSRESLHVVALSS